jgi:hypothetical protein
LQRNPQQPASPRQSNEEQLPPALRAWLDNVIVPAMVKEWLAAEPEVHGVDSGAKSHDAESEATKLRCAIPGVEKHSKI